jgi:hypothetical protein
MTSPRTTLESLQRHQAQIEDGALMMRSGRPQREVFTRTETWLDDLEVEHARALVGLSGMTS